MRKLFAKYLVEISENDDAVYLIVGDIGFGVFDEFKKKFPSRFFNFGICEQSMIGIAAGMALSGLKPYVYTITPFLTERPFEQLKVDIDINKANVKLIGYDDYPTLGPTHEMLDNGRYMSSFKNIISYFPKNDEEVKHSLEKSYKDKTPTFIRLREKR